MCNGFGKVIIERVIEMFKLNREMCIRDRYKRRWCGHVARMPDTRLPVATLTYKPSGRRDVGRPRDVYKRQVICRPKQYKICIERNPCQVEYKTVPLVTENVCYS